jgi:hypothetical protein
MPQPGEPVVSTPLTPTPPKEKSSRGTLIETIVLIAVCIVAATAIVFAVVFYLQWNDSKTNVQGQIDSAVATATEEQRAISEANFAEREKLPNLEFVGPADYGSLSFMYPRTWSVFVNRDASTGGDFEAYFNPIQVNPLGENTINALRVYIFDRPIDQVRAQYDALVRNGDLTSSVYTVGNITGTKYEGAFNPNITGIALMIKINDKTAIIRTDAEIFRRDFETLISTIRTN